MTYKLFTRGQSEQVLERQTKPFSSETVAIIRNGPNGWMAYRAARTDRMSSMGPIFEPTGEGVNVSRLVNQHGGADRIAKALGL